MGFNVWIIFASILLVSARARRYDSGPHTFYDFSTGLATAGPYGEKEVVLYLTPDQVRALETDGAVVKSDKDDENSAELSAEQQANEKQDDNDENNDSQEEEEEEEENDDALEEKEENDNSQEDVQQEEESPEDNKKQNIDFEAILKLLNEDQIDEETVNEQPLNEPQIEEEITEKPRIFSPRFQFRQQQDQKNIALAGAKKEQLLKTYSNIRYQPYGQRFDYESKYLQQEDDASISGEFDEKLIGTPIQGTKKYKLIPYQIEERVEEPAPTVNTQQQSSEAEKEVQTAISNKRLRNALQKYALRVQKLQTTEKIIAQAKAIKATVPVLSKQQLSKKQIKNGKAPARNANTKKAKPQLQKSIAVPVMVPEKSAVQKPIKVPVETSKLVSNKPRKLNANKTRLRLNKANLRE